MNQSQRRRLPYNPAHDPRFPERVLDDLRGHPGQRRRLTRLYRATPDLVKGAVRQGRRQGMDIRGTRGRNGGYTYLPEDR